MASQQECIQEAMAVLAAADDIEATSQHPLPLVPSDVTRRLRTTVLRQVMNRYQQGPHEENLTNLLAGVQVQAEDYETHHADFTAAYERLRNSGQQAHDELSLFALQQLLSCVGGAASPDCSSRKGDPRDVGHFDEKCGGA